MNMVFDNCVPRSKEEKGMGYIYVYCFDNGYMYVGQTIKTVRTRHLAHCGSGNCCLVDKYIKTHNFRLDILGKYPYDELDDCECNAIKMLNTLYPNGLNFEGGGNKNKIKSDYTRRLISISATGRKMSPEAVKKSADANRGRKHTDEHRKKISASLKKYYTTHKQRPREHKPCSDETKKKISEALKGKIVSEEQRKHLSEIMMGKHQPEEVRRKISIAHKGRKKSDETRRRMSEAMKGKKKGPMSEEHRKQISESMKRYYKNKGDKKCQQGE